MELNDIVKNISAMEHNREYSNEEYDVIIIGGGLSGVSAAYTIANHDPSLNLLIIEKTDHLAGRRYSANKNALCFVSNTNYFLKELLRELNMTLIRRQTVGASIAELENGTLYKSWDKIPIFGSVLVKARLELFLAKVEDMCRNVSISLPNGTIESDVLDAITMETFISDHLKDESSQIFMRNVVHASIGLQANEISALFYIAYCNSTYGLTNQYGLTEDGITGCILKGGATRICDDIKHLYLFDVNYRETVTSIMRKKRSSLVRTNKELFKCSYVVVALSPASISQISFEPPISESREKVLRNMLQTNKRTVFATFSENIFEPTKSGDIFCGPGGAFVRFLNTFSFKPNSLVGITCHENVDFDQLTKCLKKEVSPIDVIYLYNQSVSVPAMNCLKHFNEIRRPLSRVFWAGSCTSTIWYGHEEGAVHSGIRAAIELLYDYKPQVLSVKDIVALTGRKPMVTVYKDSFINSAADNKKFYLIMLVVGGVVGGLATFLMYKRIRNMKLN